jgi:predicted transcriptional regulator
MGIKPRNARAIMDGNGKTMFPRIPGQQPVGGS